MLSLESNFQILGPGDIFTNVILFLYPFSLVLWGNTQYFQRLGPNFLFPWTALDVWQPAEGSATLQLTLRKEACCHESCQSLLLLFHLSLSSFYLTTCSESSLLWKASWILGSTAYRNSASKLTEIWFSGWIKFHWEEFTSILAFLNKLCFVMWLLGRTRREWQ